MILEVPALRPTILALTGLRFFLAVAVVLFHYGEKLAPRFPSPLRNLLGSGFLAVDVFFLLSGFVMAYNYLDGADGSLRGSTSRFWQARAARIMPVYWVGMLLFAPVAISQLWQGDALAFGAIFLSAALLVQAWMPSLAIAWNGPGWSLSVEALFYLVFPRLGPWLWRSKRPWAASGLCWGLLLASAAAISWVDPHAPAWPWSGELDNCDWNKVLSFNPLLRVPEFAGGILACRIWRDAGWGARWLSRPWLAWAIPVTVGGLLGWRTPLHADLTALGLFFPALAAWLVALTGKNAVARFLARATCVRLGEWSYALYILHVPVWALTLSVNQENGSPLDPLGLPFLSVTFAVAVALSGAVHHFVEIPYRMAFLQAFGKAARLKSLHPRPAQPQ